MIVSNVSNIIDTIINPKVIITDFTYDYCTQQVAIADSLKSNINILSSCYDIRIQYTRSMKLQYENYQTTVSIARRRLMIYLNVMAIRPHSRTYSIGK